MPRALAAVVVFVSAAAVLVLEILALRLAAPHVGLTLDTYSAAIGVALLGIAVGASFGGRLADRVDPRLSLGPTLVAGGGLALLARPMADWLGPNLAGSGPAGAVALVFASIGPAVIVLSMPHPAVVKLRLSGLDETGATVGGLSAVGTLGALGGTFLTGFVLLGELSTREIALATAVALIALGFIVAVLLRQALPVPVLLIVVPAAGLLAIDQGHCDRETRYFCVRVDERGPDVRLLRLDDLQHAQVHLADARELSFPYTRWVAEVVDALPPGPLATLHVGGGGFTLPRYIDAVRPGSRQVALELDPGVVEVAREELWLRDETRVRTGDARTLVRDEPTGGYDVVVGDVFASRAVPWHLTTVEFVRDLDRVLRDDGVYVMNLIDAGSLAFLRAELATLRSVFEHVAVVGRERGNFVTIASHVPLPETDLELRRADDVIAGAGSLRDDFAPVDQLMSAYAAASTG